MDAKRARALTEKNAHKERERQKFRRKQDEERLANVLKSIESWASEGKNRFIADIYSDSDWVFEQLRTKDFVIERVGSDYWVKW